MCVIILCPPRCRPMAQDLQRATKINDDGHGWAVRTPGGLITWRGLDPKVAIETFDKARSEHPNDWAMWHSRMATHGTVNTDNCQPFVVPGRNWVMAHNGILPLSDGPFNTGRSDSRILAEDHVSRMSWQQLDADEFKRIDDWISPSKVVILSGDTSFDIEGGDLPFVLYGEQRGRWSTLDDCWYSSTISYSYGSIASRAYGYDVDDDDWIPPRRSTASSSLLVSPSKDRPFRFSDYSPPSPKAGGVLGRPNYDSLLDVDADEDEEGGLNDLSPEESAIHVAEEIDRAKEELLAFEEQRREEEAEIWEEFAKGCRSAGIAQSDIDSLFEQVNADPSGDLMEYLLYQIFQTEPGTTFVNHFETLKEFAAAMDEGQYMEDVC